MYLNVFNFSRRVAGKRAFANDLKLLHAVSGAVLLHPAVNRLSLTGPLPTEPDNSVCNHHVDDILSYINQNISSPLTLSELSKEFFLSESYICRIFKSATGTTINKYITARRISIAKSLLSDGVSVMTAYEKSGFTDYSAFFKAFTKAVGISPKKYARYSS